MASATLSKPKPTIVIVAGAWHTLIHMAPLATALSSQSYPTIALALTTSGSADKGLADDVAMITSYLEDVVDQQGKDVVLVVHSYGGVPASAAAAAFLRSGREKQGKTGGVIEVLFLAGFAIPKGASPLHALGGKHAPFVMEEGRICNPANPQQVFYNDMPKLDADFYASKLVPHALSSFEQVVPDDCFNGAVPCTYLLCEKDNCVPPFVQEMNIKNIGEGCKVEKCDAGHSPYLSQLDLVVNLVRKIAGEKI